MINFSDEWTVYELAKCRSEMFLDEARDYARIKEARGPLVPETTLRYSLGLKMIRLGQQISGIAA